MTPQEQELVEDLFDRLAKLESMPRDPAAERLIAEGARGAPHALYALVQTALLQDEALKRANARIEELQAQLGGGEEPQQRQGGFLDSMRDALGFGEPRGSVPSVRAGRAGPPWRGDEPGGPYPQQMPPPGYAGGPAFGTGGSFLGNAASTAAGVLGGALLLDGIRSMFGHQSAHASQGFGDIARGREAPWGGGAADSQLARDAGIGHIGDRTRDADREQDRQQDLADDDREQDAQQDLADEDAEQDREQDLADDQDFGGDDGSYDDD